jgi:hypothetical protein
MRYALPRPEILSYPLETNVIDSVVLNSAGVAPDASGPYMNRRYLVAGTVLSKRPDNTYEAYTGATSVAAVNQQQQLQVFGPPTGGTFAVGFRGQETAQLPYNVTAAALQTALQGLSTIGAGNATVTGAYNTGGFVVTFVGADAATELPRLSVDATQLQGTGNQDIIVNELQQGSAAEATQNVAGILFDTVEFADGSALSDEPVAMLRKNVSFKASNIVNFAANQAAIVAGLPTCEFI